MALRNPVRGVHPEFCAGERDCLITPSARIARQEWEEELGERIER